MCSFIYLFIFDFCLFIYVYVFIIKIELKKIDTNRSFYHRPEESSQCTRFVRPRHNFWYNVFGTVLLWP